jgi:hypothetical protein
MAPLPRESWKRQQGLETCPKAGTDATAGRWFVTSREKAAQTPRSVGVGDLKLWKTRFGLAAAHTEPRERESGGIAVGFATS